MMHNKFAATFTVIIVIGLCLATAYRLLYFLSFYPLSSHLGKATVETDIEKHYESWRPIIMDSLFLAFFITQHSFQARQTVKIYLERKGYFIFERLIYNFFTCAILQLLMSFWQPHHWNVWEMSTSSEIYWTFIIIHTTAWIIVYSGCLTRDIGELLGVRQVYYYFQGWPEPMAQKSIDLRRLYCHMRHPGFSSLVVILFFHPVMSLDRLILAYVLTIYMILGYRIDNQDCTYHKRMFVRKEQGLDTSG